MTDFDSYAQSAGIDVYYASIPLTRAMAVPGAICLDWSLLSRDSARAAALAHELGHVETGALYVRDASPLDRRRAEVRAERWAIRKMISREDLLAALRSGFVTPYALSEAFDLPEDVIRKALALYLLCE
ncbi:MAG: ImmA/IrrE family metallo-endopeptidase [Clostridia bacterium]|nr:ImmA/IrrE family metallo-endopeptidase [Clostridia bacterium]